MDKSIRIGNAQAFWGDSPAAALELVQSDPDLDVVTLDYLSELSLAIMAAQRKRDPGLGYACDIIDVVKDLAPIWRSGRSLRLITNGGGLNPLGCAEACRNTLKTLGLKHIHVAAVDGDDVLKILLENPDNPLFCHSETGEPLSNIAPSLATANAYLGASRIAEALDLGAHIAITGRVADPSLVVGACLHHFHWNSDAWDQLAGATLAGHLIECGTQVTGGLATNWLDMPDRQALGFPIIEVYEEGCCVVTKPKGTGGMVSEATVKEQMLYEMGDPACYLSPDVTMSIMGVSVTELEPNRIFVTGAAGSPFSPYYKVAATYEWGFKAEAILGVFGAKAPIKARKAGEMLMQRLARRGVPFDRCIIECLGQGDIAAGVIPGCANTEAVECALRLAVADRNRSSVEIFSREVASLVTSGPPGIVGYASGRPRVRPVFGYWPCLIDRACI